MDDTERAAEVHRLMERLSEATARRRALAEEARNLAGMIGGIREAFGRPFYYSGPQHGLPENREKSAGTYTGSASHDVVLPTILQLKEADRVVTSIRDRLRALGQTVE